MLQESCHIVNPRSNSRSCDITESYKSNLEPGKLMINDLTHESGQYYWGYSSCLLMLQGGKQAQCIFVDGAKGHLPPQTSQIQEGWRFPNLQWDRYSTYPLEEDEIMEVIKSINALSTRVNSVITPTTSFWLVYWSRLNAVIEFGDSFWVGYSMERNCLLPRRVLPRCQIQVTVDGMLKGIFGGKLPVLKLLSDCWKHIFRDF